LGAKSVLRLFWVKKVFSGHFWVKIVFLGYFAHYNGNSGSPLEPDRANVDELLPSPKWNVRRLLKIKKMQCKF